MKPQAPSLTIVIPALNEAGTLPPLLEGVAPLGAEVVVVDGGSSDDTLAVATAAGARVVSSARGRGVQLRAGAAGSRSEWLLFLHADSRISPEGLQAIRGHCDSASLHDFAHFRFALDGGGPFHRMIEVGQAVRERWFGLVYGDQGLLVSRALYEAVGGFPEWVIMEDVGLIDRLGRAGRRVRLDHGLTTSTRRYDSEGTVQAWLRNTALIVAFRAGIAPSTLARWYRPHAPSSSSSHSPVSAPGSSSGEDRAVIVFAKAPVAGRVKTRLAASIGDVDAVRIYRRLAEDTVTALRDGPWRLFVYVDPGPGNDTDRRHSLILDTVRTWLGPTGVEYRVQQAGDLGSRMSAAFAECFAECSEVCIVGTDLPDMQASWVEESFEKVGDADVVLGPATDGGYYLMTLRRPAPELFRDVEWSTADVLATTLARASAAGMQVVQLPFRTDVDTLDDVPHDLLAG